MYGENLIFFGGRLIAGPDARHCALTFLLVLAPSVLWHVEVGVFWIRRSGAFVLVVVFVLLQIISLTSLVLTAFSDPGIIPRQGEFDETLDPRTGTHRPRQPARYFDLLLRGHPYKLKYCTTCNIYRPPRCTHCSVCENCIERFDHHCPWIGNCIGKRNYWFFFTFVSSTGMLTIIVFVSAALQFFTLLRDQDEGAFGELLQATMGKAPLATTLVLYCLGSGWFTIGLGVYHGYLVCVNQTTYEQVKGIFTEGSNPFDRGVRGNCYDVLFSPVRRRYFEPATGRFLWPSSEHVQDPVLAKHGNVLVGLKSRTDKVIDASFADSEGTEAGTETCNEKTGNEV